MEDLRALGGYAQPGEPDHRVRSREVGGALVPVWGADLSGWLPDRRDIGIAATAVMTVSGMASLWAVINGGAFVVWFWKALTVDVPYPKSPVGTVGDHPGDLRGRVDGRVRPLQAAALTLTHPGARRRRAPADAP